MRRKRCIVIAVLGLAAGGLLVRHASAVELRSDLLLLGQVRDGDQSRETEAPNDFYGDIGVAGLPHGICADTYFRLEHDFGTGDSASNLYASYLRVPGAIPGLDFTLGRQFLSEIPDHVFVADGGKVRIDPGWPVAFTLFGGQTRYFEPTYSSPVISRDEQIWGGSVRFAGWKRGQLQLGFLQQERDQRTLRQLITANVTRAFPQLPGLPNFYGTFAYDSDHQNIDRGTAGVQLFLSQPRALLHVEGTYYKPQDQGTRLVTDIDRREDTVFELFSLSDLLQFRGGLRYVLNPSLSAYGNYSYQHYDRQPSTGEDGHIGSVGLLWLPGGDGLEVVRLEYYVIDSDGGNVNGGKAYYESSVYERLLFRTKLDITYYDKITNQSDTAVSSLLALGYALVPGLYCELNFEANHNARFDEDFRFGFLISYDGRHRFDRASRAAEETAS